VNLVSLCFRTKWPDATILSAGEASSGLELIDSDPPDIVMLDLGLPDIDGLEVLRRIRGSAEVPVVILTVRDQDIEKVEGLELGADDYITKPFSHFELLARVKAVLRRSSKIQLEEKQEVFSWGKLRMNFATREVHLGEKPIKLTPIEYNLLYQLVRNAGQVIPHQTLLEKVWGLEYTDASDYLKVYIQRLREKLEDTPTPRMLLSKRGVGYKFAKPE